MFVEELWEGDNIKCQVVIYSSFYRKFWWIKLEKITWWDLSRTQLASLGLHKVSFYGSCWRHTVQLYSNIKRLYENVQRVSAGSETTSETPAEGGWSNCHGGGEGCMSVSFGPLGASTEIYRKTLLEGGGGSLQTLPSPPQQHRTDLISGKTTRWV